MTVSGQAEPGVFRRIVIVADRPNPTLDLYLGQRSTLSPGLPVEVVAPTSRPVDLQDAMLVHCRYLDDAWLDAGEAAAVVALLIDDDMAGMLRDGTLPGAYRWRLWRRSVSRWSKLRRRLDVVFVSTAEVARRWRATRVEVMPPIAEAIDLQPPATWRDPPRFAFHQTASHLAEHRWLRRLAPELLARCPGWRLEVAAAGQLVDLWSGLEGVDILPVMPWDRYRRETGQLGRRVLLAPFRPSRVNAARSASKRIDAARMGAALVVSDAAVYALTAEERSQDMMIPYDAGAWVEGLAALSRDPERVAALAARNRRGVEQAHAAARPLCVPAETPGFWRLA